MVGTIGYQLQKNRLITGFGVRRKTYSTKRSTGRGPSKTALLKRISTLLGAGRKRVYRKRRTTTAGSYKLSGQGRRKPRATLGIRRRYVY